MRCGNRRSTANHGPLCRDNCKRFSRLPRQNQQEVPGDNFPNCSVSRCLAVAWKSVLYRVHSHIQPRLASDRISGRSAAGPCQFLGLTARSSRLHRSDRPDARDFEIRLFTEENEVTKMPDFDLQICDLRTLTRCGGSVAMSGARKSGDYVGLHRRTPRPGGNARAPRRRDSVLECA
jgi:hypothetical protein